MTRKSGAMLGLALGGILMTSSIASQAQPESHQGSHQGPHTEAGAVRLQLPAELRDALRAEMREVQQAMQELVPAIAAGDWEGVAKLARQIEGSYLLKQKLDEKQRKALHEALPEGFLQLDREFHALAGMLAHVTHAPHVELVSFYYYKLADGCLTCHSRYARERFPAFAVESAHHGHDHHGQ